jgi:DNA-directed RNA polymerase III subunit RPC2
MAGVGQRVWPGQIYINKQSPANANDMSAKGGMASATSWRNTPMTYRGAIPAYIDKVMLSDTDNDQTLIKVLTRQTRRPELGDKFSSRHGQKGVCGLIVEQADMPFNDIGVCPDIIMNPHGFPSRMTGKPMRFYLARQALLSIVIPAVGKMLELLTGKASKYEFGSGIVIGVDDLVKWYSRAASAMVSLEGH